MSDEIKWDIEWPDHKLPEHVAEVCILGPTRYVLVGFDWALGCQVDTPIIVDEGKK